VALHATPPPVLPQRHRTLRHRSPQLRLRRHRPRQRGRELRLDPEPLLQPVRRDAEPALRVRAADRADGHVDSAGTDADADADAEADADAGAGESARAQGAADRRAAAAVQGPELAARRVRGAGGGVSGGYSGRDRGDGESFRLGCCGGRGGVRGRVAREWGFVEFAAG